MRYHIRTSSSLPKVDECCVHFAKLQIQFNCKEKTPALIGIKFSKIKNRTLARETSEN